MIARTLRVWYPLILIAAAGMFFAACEPQKIEPPKHQWPPDRLILTYHPGKGFAIGPAWKDTIVARTFVWTTQDTIPCPPKGFTLKLVRQDTIP